MGKKAWVISVNMGYGHQRTAFPLRHLAKDGKVINANYYKGITEEDRKIWGTTRKFYEAVSLFSRTPLVGKVAFSAYDRFQRTLEFYPKRNLSRPNFAVKRVYSLLKTGWGRHLIEKLKSQKPSPNGRGERGELSSQRPSKVKSDLPIVSTFFTPAFMAEFFGYPGEIFCVVCDADVSRAWAPLNPKESRIKYVAPTERVVERLKLYGIKPENIFLTGYPLPKENIGTKKIEVLKKCLRERLLNLDPKRRYREKYKALIKDSLGRLPRRSGRPLTVMFSVGGAGAQREIGIKILKCLAPYVKRGRVRMILSAGTKLKVKNYFDKNIEKLGFKGNNNVKVIFKKDIDSYFKKFNRDLQRTDILWTKPSELSFYSALGIPIIIAPPIGSQEDFNMRWLLKSGFGLFQENPNYVNQWLFDWLDQGYLAEAAMQGFVEGEKLGTYNIKKVCCG